MNLDDFIMSDEQIAMLSPEEAAEAIAALGELEESLDLQDGASGLTTDLQTFFRQAWDVIEPETPLVWSWHYEDLCEWLTMISTGEFKKKFPEKLGIIVNVPPRTGKSLFITVCWPVWTWLRNPERRFLCGSYSGKLAVDHSNKRRFLIKSNWFQRRFGERFALTTDKVDDLRNDRTGYFIATSVDGTGTGFGGDICIGDDLLNAKDAHSRTSRLSTNQWLDDTWRRRLNDPRSGVFVHVSQRLAADDPTGHLLEKNPNEWIHLKITREAEAPERHVFPVSGRVVDREAGDVLQPERCPPHQLASLKLSSREWAGQEQQQPAPAGGIVFDPNWWRYYKKSDPLPAFDSVILTVDCAFKSKEQNDYVAIHKWATCGNRRYWLSRKTEHLGYVATKAAIKAERQEQTVPWCSRVLPKAKIVLIEDKANGSAVIEELRLDPEFGAAILAIEPDGGKDSRAYSASADCEAGNIFIPEDAPWIGKVVEMFSQWAGEGSIPHDDDIDAMSQIVNWSRDRFGAFVRYLENSQATAKAKIAETKKKLEERVNGGNGSRPPQFIDPLGVLSRRSFRER